MKFLEPMIIAFSMYSKIPVPYFEWKKEDMRFSLIFLPAVGAFIGALEMLCFYLCGFIGINYARIFFLTAVPVLFTGGLHLDGYMDTSDALASYGDREKKLAILKDSHIGAFAVIRIILYFLILIGVMFTAEQYSSEMFPTELALLFVISRISAAFAMLFLHSARQDGIEYTFSKNADRKIVITVLSIISAAVIFLCIYTDVLSGCLVIISNILLFIIYRRRMYREFGGITGDTEGWLICMSELAGTAALALGSIL